jgi:hypothetical protein
MHILLEKHYIWDSRISPVVTASDLQYHRKCTVSLIVVMRVITNLKIYILSVIWSERKAKWHSIRRETQKMQLALRWQWISQLPSNYLYSLHLSEPMSFSSPYQFGYVSCLQSKACTSCKVRPTVISEIEEIRIRIGNLILKSSPEGNKCGVGFFYPIFHVRGIDADAISQRHQIQWFVLLFAKLHPNNIL